MPEFYTRFLPHWHPEDEWLFITWRLAGSLPYRPDLVKPHLTAGQRFVLMDEQDDRGASGERWLADPRIAQLVADAITLNTPTLYELGA